MHNGLARFEYYLNKLQVLITAASKQKNPALWLYRNEARTPLFMLEALAKMYAELHNNKKFTKIKEHFKVLEDAIGAIDYYDAIAKDLSVNKKIPPGIITYLQAQTREKIQSLNELLVEKGWINKSNSRLAKIHKKLSDADWLKEGEEVKAIEEFYGAEMYKITEFVQETGFHFDNMESDVHELRRRLRWLSIYPQALRGTIQLAEKKPMAKHLKKYCTHEITNSSFNKMPEKGTYQSILVLEQNHFYSLSWMIAQLGKLKDEGLHIIALKEAVQEKEAMTDDIAYKKVYRLLGNQQTTLQPLLSEAEKIAQTFFKEQNLEHLVIAIEN